MPENAVIPVVRETDKAQTPMTITQRGIELVNYYDLQQFAALVVESGLVPTSFGTTQKNYQESTSPEHEKRQKIAAAAVVIECGLEIGLRPMQALQNVAACGCRHERRSVVQRQGGRACTGPVQVAWGANLFY